MSGVKKTNKQQSSTFSCRVLSFLFVFLLIAGVVYVSYPSNTFENVSVTGMQPGTVAGTDSTQSVSSNSETRKPPVETSISPTTTVAPSAAETKQNEEIIAHIKELRRRGLDFLNWVTKDGEHNPQPSFIRWDLIAKADIHIIHKFVSYIDFHMENPTRLAKLLSIYKYGYKCDAMDTMRQELITKLIHMDICSEVEWYKFLHFAWPEASTFLDVGANKGYLGSLFLTLWGGANLHASPIELYQVAKKQESWKTSRNPVGYCRDGDHHGTVTYCPPGSKRDAVTGRCDAFNPKVRIYSLDGSSYLTHALSQIIQEFPVYTHNQQSYRASEMWSYRNFAVSDVEGTARFTKQSKEKNPGYEGGGIRNNQGSVSDSEEEVPMTSVDRFLQVNNITHVDVLKIDTEGNDNKVLRGAKTALAKSIGMFAFEGGKGVSFSKEMIYSLDKIGFSCYSTSRAGLYKWNAGCMKERYMGGFPAKDKGNIFCVSRTRAPLAAFAFEVLTFPAIFAFLTDPDYIQRQPTVQQKQDLQGLLTAVNTTSASNANELNLQVDPKLLLPSYIQLRGFCEPWPVCARIKET